MSSTRVWDAVLLVGVLCFMVGGAGALLGWIVQPAIAMLAVLGLILIGAGASGKRRARGAL